MEILADGQTLRIKSAEVGQAVGMMHLPLFSYRSAIILLFFVYSASNTWEVYLLETFCSVKRILS